MGTPQRVFMVDGKPFFPLGGQSRNSSGYNQRESEAAFEAVKLLHGNTLEIPVYWEQIEPEEGRFDFASVDALLAGARRHGLKLILLWFGTWKNGDMDYTPAWVKTEPERFQRVETSTGREIWVLSAHCAETRAADKRAFVALCRRLKETDAQEHTVIGIQIENEPGILGSDRDYSGEAQQAFDSPAPPALVTKVAAAGRGAVYDEWKRNGARKAGSWFTLFGDRAGEFMTAWAIATYIDSLAEAGKAVLNVPMYINVWLAAGGWQVAGEYPSGGAIPATLDIYKWFTPHVDLIAPDIYVADSRGYEAMCQAYARADNPLFVPESGPGGANAWNMMRAIGEHNAIGYAFFAVEHVLDGAGGVAPAMQPIVDSVRAVAAAIPLLLQYQGTGKMHAVVQEENLRAQPFAFDGYHGLAEFGDASVSRPPKDWRHTHQNEWVEQGGAGERGRGLIVQTSRNEFYLVGAGYRLMLRPHQIAEHRLDASLASDMLRKCLAQYLLVDEGHFDADGRFVVDRRRNGDETNHGIWVAPDCGVVHVVLCD